MEALCVTEFWLEGTFVVRCISVQQSALHAFPNPGRRKAFSNKQFTCQGKQQYVTYSQ
jgi:hypothetical protein